MTQAHQHISGPTSHPFFNPTMHFPFHRSFSVPPACVSLRTLIALLCPDDGELCSHSPLVPCPSPPALLPFLFPALAHRLSVAPATTHWILLTQSHIAGAFVAFVGYCVFSWHFLIFLSDTVFCHSRSSLPGYGLCVFF